MPVHGDVPLFATLCVWSFKLWHTLRAHSTRKTFQMLKVRNDKGIHVTSPLEFAQQSHFSLTTLFFGALSCASSPCCSATPCKVGSISFVLSCLFRYLTLILFQEEVHAQTLRKICDSFLSFWLSVPVVQTKFFGVSEV